MKRSTGWKVLVTGVLMTSMASTTFFYNQNASLTAKYEQEITQKDSEISHLKEDMSGLDQEIQKKSDLLNARTGFTESLTSARTVLSAAEKLGNVTASAEVMMQAQETVYQERNSYRAVMVQTEKVNKEASKLRGEKGVLINSSSKATEPIYEDEIGYPVKNLKVLPANHPARLALDAVGGNDVRLGTAEHACNNDQAIACAFDSNIILVDESYVNEDYDHQYLVMMHEYAHQIQYDHLDAMKYAKGFNELFSKDIEWLADCMAAAKIDNYSSGYNYKCTEDQKEYGAKAWSGTFS